MPKIKKSQSVILRVVVKKDTSYLAYPSLACRVPLKIQHARLGLLQLALVFRLLISPREITLKCKPARLLKP